LFKYGGSENAGDDNDDDIVVYYWSPPDKNVHNTSGDLEQPRRASVTVDQQQHQQMHLLATSSFAQSPVHSAAVVLTIAGMRLYRFKISPLLKSLNFVSCVHKICEFYDLSKC